MEVIKVSDVEDAIAYNENMKNNAIEENGHWSKTAFADEYYRINGAVIDRCNAAIGALNDLIKKASIEI